MDNAKPNTRRFSKAAQVKGLNPEAKVYEASDKTAQGLILRVQPSGRRTWFYRYREARGPDGKQGKLHRIEIGEYPTVSLEAARTARHGWAARRGNKGTDDPHIHIGRKLRQKAAQEALEALQADADAWTLQRVGEEWIAAQKREGRRTTTTREAARQLAKDVYPIIGHLPAAKVTADDVLEVLHKIEKRRAMRLRNAVRVTMQSMYNWAAHDGPKHLRRHPNPVSGTRRKKDGDRPKRQRRALTESELKVLWPHLLSMRGNVYEDALALALLCGTRAMETVSASWDNIDLDAGTWTIPETITKNKRRHLVILSDEAKQLLEARKADGCFVFALPTTQSGHARKDTAWKRLREHQATLGLDTGMTLHELRHSVLTFVERHYGVGTRERVANHKRQGLSAIYNHATYDEEAAEAWQAWGAHLESLRGSIPASDITRAKESRQ